MTSEPGDGRNGLSGGSIGSAHALAILDAALDGVVTIDHRGCVLEFNRAAEVMFGYREVDVLGEELAELVVPPELRDAHRSALARWTATGPTDGAGGLLGHRVEVQAMRSDGSEFPAELAISRLEVPGAPLFTACIRDISERTDSEERLRTAEFRYRTLVEQLPFISYVDDQADPSAKALYVSPQIEAVLGYTPDEWLTVPDLYELAIHEDDRRRVLAERVDAYARGATLRHEYRIHARDGRPIWVEDASVRVEPPEGGIPFRQGFVLDITERKRAEDAIRSAEIRYRTLVEQLPLAVYIDRIDDASSNIYTSPQIESMLGYSVDEWVSTPTLMVDILHADDRERVLAAHRRTHATGDPLLIEYRYHARDGRVVWIRDDARIIEDPRDGQPVLQGYLLDITAQREAEERLRYQAFHDPLTGLANRAVFRDRVEHALERQGNVDGAAAVLFLDLDDFKGVNDTLGHPAGDALLQAVGQRLRGALPPSHTIARLGGDEFAVLVEDEGDVLAPAVDAAERVNNALQASFDLDGCDVFVTASIGVAVGGRAEELLRSADIAMYRAKASGKAQYVVYAPKMDGDVEGRLELVADLRKARLEDELVLHYQPTVELATGAIVGIEALVRWQHPTRGLLEPSDFIALAEETGSIVDIGRRVLLDGCRQVARCRSEHPGARSLSLSVNVSLRQMRGHGLVADVRRALSASGLPAQALTLEITESVLARRRDEMARILDEITDLGVRLALDDFGTGYSSLSQLQDLPVHILKIDRSFVQSLDAGPERYAFVRAIADLGKSLGLDVVAEGIETRSQIAELRQLGCRLGQGFYFARPLASRDLEALLARAPAPGRFQAA